MLLTNASAGNSPIHGSGLFAREIIPAGTVIWELTPGFDCEMTPREFDGLDPASREAIRRYVYTDMETGMIVLCQDDARYMNHADRPNTRTVGRQTIALVEIRPGEEMTCNYAEFDAVSAANGFPG
jgi:uncharacterized protein